MSFDRTKYDNAIDELGRQIAELVRGEEEVDYDNLDHTGMVADCTNQVMIQLDAAIEIAHRKLDGTE